MTDAVLSLKAIAELEGAPSYSKLRALSRAGALDDVFGAPQHTARGQKGYPTAMVTAEALAKLTAPPERLRDETTGRFVKSRT